VNVKRGEVVAILGPNGAGKTTLMRAICGLVRTRGKILFGGEDISKLKPYERIRRGIAISPEGRRLFPNMSVEDNLLMGAVLSDNYDEKAEFIFDIFPKLRERRKQAAKTMSGGEQQMLAIARALMSDPKLLLLDEPSIGLAPVVVDAIGDAIERIKKEMEISILLVEQNVHLAFEVADRAYVLVGGEIVAEGNVDELKDLEEHYFYSNEVDPIK
jgi:branched-chain amino acid transport system ATP-binding protein